MIVPISPPNSVEIEFIEKESEYIPLILLITYTNDSDSPIIASLVLNSVRKLMRYLH